MTRHSDQDARQLATIEIPEMGLVVLIGASGSGKSTFATRHFLPTEILSSDVCRGLVSDDENSLEATKDAFALLHAMLEIRLRRGLLSVVDATNVQPEGRQSLLRLAKEHHCLSTAIVLDMPERLCIERNTHRPDRTFGAYVITRQRRELKRSLKHLKHEGFRQIKRLQSVAEVEAARFVRTKLWTDRRELQGPFDIVGDVHGCFKELCVLLERLGYGITPRQGHPVFRWSVSPPPGRTLLFVGDLVDRGPATPDVLSLVMGMVEEGSALCVCGNHEVKLHRALKGKKTTPSHGLAQSLAQLDGETTEFRLAVTAFLDGLLSHYMLDGGKLCLVHAGLREDYQGRASGRVRSFAMYGDTTGEVDGFGLPVRLDWAADYRGAATVVYGHTPVHTPQWRHNTLCIDTGCVFGGALTALRYPEREVVSVPAKAEYCVPSRPLEEASTPSDHPHTVDLADVTGKRFLETRLAPKIVLTTERSISALEVMTRFAIDPRWLITLPPTMSPPATTLREGLLEHPDEAFAYYGEHGQKQVICQAKHMGSRALMVVLKTPKVAQHRFGFEDPAQGVIYTRSGRRFFGDHHLEAALLGHVRAVMEELGWFERFETDWFCLDLELMPWSAKAKQLLRHQYAAVGAAAIAALPPAIAALNAAAARGLNIGDLLEKTRARQGHVEKFRQAYAHYCWEVDELADYKLAPFHILASEGCAHIDKDHLWHMARATELAKGDPMGVLMATDHVVVDLDDQDAVAAGVSWWQERVDRGEEGMVVKPREFVAHDPVTGQVVQPAIKCRGPEYLRIIYGPEYLEPHNLHRLRERNVRRKRSQASREFALGVDALESFVRHDALYRVHERVFGVLALQSEPMDPRL